MNEINNLTNKKHNNTYSRIFEFYYGMKNFNKTIIFKHIKQEYNLEDYQYIYINAINVENKLI